MEENNFRSIREDYDTLNKKFHGLKKQNEILLNNYEDVKEENFVIKQENEKLQKRMSSNVLVQEHYREMSNERDRKVFIY
jgi:regulator of replication initiation timing